MAITVILTPYILLKQWFAGRSPYDKRVYKRSVYRNWTHVRAEFYVCPKCKSYEGGLYGVGPIRYYRSKDTASCIHDWVLITKDEFITGVKNDFNVDLLQVDYDLFSKEDV